jgi:structure-specific recognition protein 1
MSDESEEDEDYDMEADVRKQKKERAEESSSEGSGSEPDLEYDSGDSDVSDDIAGIKSKKAGGSRKDKPSTSKSSGSKKSGKGEKDPHAPKRPQTAFFLWQGENRASIKKPGDSITDTASRAGQMWKAMGEVGSFSSGCEGSGGWGSCVSGLLKFTPLVPL